MTGLWAAPHATRPVRGSVTVPASKSLTNRYLLLAALADGPSRVANPLVSRDAELMRGAVTALGVDVRREPADRAWVLTPPPRLRGGGQVDCGLAGTVLRFVPPVAALADGPVTFDGDPEARARPLAPLLGALRDLGVQVDAAPGDRLPFTVHGTGRVTGGDVEIDASGTSQFLSALLLLGARCDQGLRVRHTGGRLPSLPHVAMTEQVLTEADVRVERTGDREWHVAPGPVRALHLTVEPDLSSAAPMLAAAAVTGGSVTVSGWPHSTTQAGDRMREVLSRMGARVELGETGLTVHGPGEPGRPGLRGVDLDLHDAGELTPVVAAMAALADGPSVLRGVAHLRGHETDRLAALETELRRLGCDARQTDDGLAIVPAPLTGSTLRTYADHRMAMAAAVLGLAVPDVLVEDVGTTAKTYPGFASAWEELVG